VFHCLNEGRLPVPRTVDGVTMVPTHVPGVTPYMLGVGVVTLVSHPHFEDEPMENAGAVEAHSSRLRTPSEIVDWWKGSSIARGLDPGV